MQGGGKTRTFLPVSVGSEYNLPYYTAKVKPFLPPNALFLVFFPKKSVFSLAYPPTNFRSAIAVSAQSDQGATMSSNSPLTVHICTA